ncbi:MAG: hypothetical protein ACREV5_06030 [Steroidobacter sp.]
MAWFVIRDAFGEVLELTHCSDEYTSQLERMHKAVKSWRQNGDQAVQLDELKFRMTSFDGNVRVLSIEPHSAHAAESGLG